MAWNSICVEVFAYSCISNFYIFMLDFFTRFIYFNTVVGMLFYNPKSEKVGTVWKTQIKKESSDF